jgi:hypothetical protein
MSKIEVDAIEPQSGTSLTLGASGDTITIPSGATLTNSGTATGFGKVLQVVSTTKTDTFTQSQTTTFADITGLSVSITPSASANKILVICNIYTGHTVGTQRTAFRLVRDSTAIGGGTASGSRQSAIGQTQLAGANGFASIGINFLDNPSTTSSTTYKVQMITDSNTGTVNRTGDDADVADAYGVRTSSTITVMEIAG